MEKLFSVTEYSSFFAVRHNPSGDEHPMGDGVDTLFDDEGNALVPGTPGFIETWERALNDDEQSTLEAYFPQHAENGMSDTQKNAATKFDLGQILGTPGALEALRNSGQAPMELLTRHASGDWGDLCEEDKRLNEEALKDGSRILSVYTLGTGTKLWAITEAADHYGNRAATTLLLPEEY